MRSGWEANSHIGKLGSGKDFQKMAKIVVSINRKATIEVEADSPEEAMRDVKFRQYEGAVWEEPTLTVEKSPPAASGAGTPKP